MFRIVSETMDIVRSIIVYVILVVRMCQDSNKHTGVRRGGQQNQRWKGSVHLVNRTDYSPKLIGKKEMKRKTYSRHITTDKCYVVNVE